MNQTNEASEPNPILSVRPAFKWHRVGVFLLLLACAVAIWLFLPKPALLPAVTVLPADYPIPSPPLPMPDRWIPLKANWVWLWRLRYAVLPKPPTFNIRTEIVRFRDPITPSLQQLISGTAPLVSTNGVRAWILPANEVKALGQHFERDPGCGYQAGQLSGPGGLSAGSSMTVAMVQGRKVEFGYSTTYTVQERDGSFEISGGFICSEMVTNSLPRSPDTQAVISLHTNLMLVANMQIPRGMGVFLYDTNRVLDPNGGVGILIRARVQ